MRHTRPFLLPVFAVIIWIAGLQVTPMSSQTHAERKSSRSSRTNSGSASDTQNVATAQTGQQSSNTDQSSNPKASDNKVAPEVPGVTDFPPEKTVVRNGGAGELRLQLAPTSTPEEAAQQRRQTRDLLAISNRNLKRIAQLQLDANQRDMLEQVHNYIAQAKIADSSGEPQRAQVLASKARQLSDDLAGVRTILKLWPW